MTPMVFARRACIGLWGLVVCCVLAAGPASAQPRIGGYGEDPPPQCATVPSPFGSDWPSLPGSDFAPVAGDPTAYTRCVNGQPASTGQCPSGFIFQQQECILQQVGTDTITVDGISQGSPPDPSCLFCEAPPIDAAVTYRGTGVDDLQLDRVAVMASGSRIALGDSSGAALVSDGNPHNIVVPVREPQTIGGWILGPGEQVKIDAVLVFGPAVPGPAGSDPPLVATSTTSTLTAPVLAS